MNLITKLYLQNMIFKTNTAGNDLCLYCRGCPGCPETVLDCEFVKQFIEEVSIWLKDQLSQFLSK